MKRKFKVTIEGRTYDVEVEEVKTGNSSMPSLTRVSPEQKRIIEEKTDMPAFEENWGVIKAPLPGVISKVTVMKGDSVSKGAVLVVLEAMKMVNEIYSPKDGGVDDVFVVVGEQVGKGTPLVKLS